MSLFVAWLSSIGWLDGLETTSLDSFSFLHSPLRPRDVVVVFIDDQDYQDLFAGTSPLDPVRLRALVQAVDRSRAKVIGVDIDTSASIFNQTPANDWPPNVVWALSARWKDGSFYPDGKLLGKTPDPGDAFGLSVFPRDHDLRIRRYLRECPTPEGSLPTFSTALVDRWNGHPRPAASSAEHEHHLESFTLRFARAPEWQARGAISESGFRAYPARDVMRLAGQVGFRELEGKLVLIGGTYSASRDFYETNYGLVPGVELVALAVENDLQKVSIRPASHSLMILVELLEGVFMVWLFYKFRTSVALWVSLIGIPILSMVGSQMVFSTLAHWASFVPVLVATGVHVLIEHLHHYRALSRRLEEVSGQHLQPEVEEAPQTPPPLAVTTTADGMSSGGPAEVVPGRANKTTDSIPVGETNSSDQQQDRSQSPVVDSSPSAMLLGADASTDEQPLKVKQSVSDGDAASSTLTPVEQKPLLNDDGQTEDEGVTNSAPEEERTSGAPQGKRP